MALETTENVPAMITDEPKVLVQIRFEVPEQIAKEFDRRAEINNRNRTGQMKELFEIYAGKQTRSPF